jgi:uncharacterized membrane protein
MNDVSKEQALSLMALDQLRLIESGNKRFLEGRRAVPVQYDRAWLIALIGIILVATSAGVIWAWRVERFRASNPNMLFLFMGILAFMGLVFVLLAIQTWREGRRYKRDGKILLAKVTQSNIRERRERMSSSSGSSRKKYRMVQYLVVNYELELPDGRTLNHLVEKRLKSGSIRIWLSKQFSNDGTQHLIPVDTKLAMLYLDNKRMLAL